MTTVINNPSDNNSSSGIGLVVGIILLLVFVFLLFYYGLPALRGTANTTPSTGSDTSTEIRVDVPDEIDVNVNSGE